MMNGHFARKFSDNAIMQFISALEKTGGDNCHEIEVHTILDKSYIGTDIILKPVCQQKLK